MAGWRRASVAVFALTMWLPLRGFAATYIVTSTNDSGPGTLRQVITSANTTPGTNLIAFNLPGSAPFVISPQLALPAITMPAILDGATQPGFAGVPVVILSGALAGTNSTGLSIAAGNSVVRGLTISGFQGDGILLLGAGSNLISGNIVAGNAARGIVVGSDGNQLSGNFVGTDSTQAAGVGNGSSGVVISGGSGNVIGGVAAGAGNVIAFNGGDGVAVLSGTNNPVRGNAIYANNGLGISLGGLGVVANDLGDADSGANNLQNYPVLSQASGSGSSVFIRGALNSTPNTTFQVDFYDSPVADASGFGQGQVFLGSAAISTDASGNGRFFSSIPAAIAVGSYISATATDPAGNTSEFCRSQPFAPPGNVNLALGMSASPNPAPLGDQMALFVTVTNYSANTADDVAIADVLPGGMSYVYASVNQGMVVSGSNTVNCDIGVLPPGGTATLTIYVASKSAGTFTNFATVTAREYNISPAAGASQLAVTVFQPAPPTVTTQPTNQLLNLGAALNLVSGILAPPDTRYQWRLNGKNIPGATNLTYSISSLLAGDNGLYTLVACDSYGVTETQPALVSPLGLLALPASDNFASRGAFINLLGLSVVGSNAGATSEPGEPMHAGVPGGKSVWFSWTALLGGPVTFSTAGSSFDTLLAVYTGNSLTNLTEVASDDDSGGHYTSQVTFNAQAGTTYQIAIDGAYGASGMIVLTSSQNILAPLVPQNLPKPADQVVGFGGTASFSVPNASGVSYQWYLNDVAVPGANGPTLQVTNVSAANVGIYTVRASSGLRTVYSRPTTLQISELDGLPNPNVMADDKFQFVATAVANLLQKLGFKVNRLSQPATGYSGTIHMMDTGGGSSRGYSSTQIFSTYGGGTQQNEPNNCENPGGSSAWTSVQAANNGVMNMNTDGSSFNTILGVYTGNGNDFSSLSPVACNIGGGQGGTNSQVTFAASSNTVYYVAVDGVNGAYGTVVLNWTLNVPATITAQPISQTTAPGSTITLTAGAGGYPPPVCQWWCNNWKMSGATNGSLTITNFQAANAGSYQMFASNASGLAATVPATVLLNSPAHLDSFSFNPTNHAMQMRLVGIAHTNYIIQASTNLTTWIPIATNAPAWGLWNFIDTQNTNFQKRFYRVVTH